MSNSIHSDTSNTVRISARRFDMSPFHDCYANSDTVLGVVADRYYSVFNGEDPVETYWNLRKKAVLYDVPEKPWQIEGPDALAFMEKIFARRIDNLIEGRGRYAIACTDNGGTFMDGILFKMAEKCYWYVQPDGALKPWLMAHSTGFDVKVSDPKGRVLQVQGPQSKKIMADLTQGAIDETMKYFHSGYYDIGGQKLYVSRTGWTGELGYEIYTVEESSSIFEVTDHKRLWDQLMEVGRVYDMVYGSMASMEIRRLEAGILDNVTDFDESMSPFEAGLGPFIDLEKEDYIGREALLDMDQQVLLLGLKTDGIEPAYQGRVFDESKAVGHVTAAAWSPTLECGIGYVRFREPADWVGQELTVQAVDGSIVACEIVSLPFYDAEKKIPRGLDKSIP